jgi:predicted nuclease of predicted toxin-antitoxin system
MALPLYMDVHVPAAVTFQLRRREVDVLTAQEDNANRRLDVELLNRATELGRLMVTQDIRFRVLAEDWQSRWRVFTGLVYGHQTLTIGQLVTDLNLIVNCLSAEEVANQVIHLPL